MVRFFIKEEQKVNDEIVIRGPDVKHIGKVLRLSKGETIEVFDGSGRQYVVRLERVGKEEVRGVIVKRCLASRDTFPQIIVGQGIPKGKKLDFVIQKLTELGIHSFVPLLTERTILRLDPLTQKAKLSRWQRIALEASKQSRRFFPPHIDDIMTLQEFCASSQECDLKLLLWEEEGERELKEALMSPLQRKRVAILVGPEGGFSQEEAMIAQRYGFVPVSLGHSILRTETAALAVVAIVQYELGGFSPKSSDE